MFVSVALAAPVAPVALAAPDEILSDLLIDRKNIENVIQGTCYTVAKAEGGETLEVCAPSRKEAHLTIQELGKDIIHTLDPLFNR